jgi:hypothetical protein
MPNALNTQNWAVRNALRGISLKSWPGLGPLPDQPTCRILAKTLDFSRLSATVIGFGEDQRPEHFVFRIG